MGDEIVILNVGGTKFSTLRATVEKSSFLQAKMVRWNDDNDSIFIDRDPEIFRYVLSIMRGEITEKDEIPRRILGRVIKDAGYYGIEVTESILTPEPTKLPSSRPPYMFLPDVTLPIHLAERVHSNYGQDIKITRQYTPCIIIRVLADDGFYLDIGASRIMTVRPGPRDGPQTDMCLVLDPGIDAYIKPSSHKSIAVYMIDLGVVNIDHPRLNGMFEYSE